MIRRPVSVDRDVLNSIRGKTMNIVTSTSEYLVMLDKGAGGYIPGDVLTFSGSANRRKVVGVGIKLNTTRNEKPGSGHFLILRQLEDDGVELDIRVNSSSSHLRSSYSIVETSPIPNRYDVEQMALDDD